MNRITRKKRDEDVTMDDGNKKECEGEVRRNKSR